MQGHCAVAHRCFDDPHMQDVHEYVNHTKKEYARGDVHETRAECLLS